MWTFLTGPDIKDHLAWTTYAHAHGYFDRTKISVTFWHVPDVSMDVFNRTKVQRPFGLGMDQMSPWMF